MISKYLKAIYTTASQGDAREESYYPSLADLLYAFAADQEIRDCHITILPKKTDAGNPDFRIWDGKESIVGYIEAKKPGENLDLIERTDQLKRYLKTFPNLILTDFYEFRLYRNGEPVDRTFIARKALAKRGIPPPAEHEEQFLTVLSKFFAFSLPKVTTAGQLARELALRTRFLRDEVISVEMEQQQKGKGELYGFYETFKKYLISKLTEKEFADLFAQTITYGLFAARTRSANGFNRKLAYDLIPKTIGILRNVFRFVSQGDLPPHMGVMVDDIAVVLNATDVNNILHQYYRAGKGDDPVVHFYETFLSEYDPATREKRGVYYTPEPVVRYIVRGVHELLKSAFGLGDGLASREVTLLDPAAGTLTFPAEAIKLAVSEFTGKYGEGGIDSLFREHLLPNFCAFELMMAPYAIGHIKMSFLLDELGYKMSEQERFRLYLTNTLDMENLAQTHIPGLESLSNESHEAGRIKKEEKILVIMGNPPYSGISANKNEWTEKLLKTSLDGAQSYYEIDGKKLEEKKLWLQDDYVKFLRFAQWKIQKSGKGIVGMITNHSYLDNPTFRGMRQSLMKTFDEIYILDLHGNSLKKETASDGTADENVFDIMQGVAIAIFIKTGKSKVCRIYHHDLFGRREHKYEWLDHHSLNRKDYQQLTPKTPWYFFIQRNTSDIEHYNQWMRVNEIFPVNTVGFVTGRDSLTIGFKASELWNQLSQFSKMDPEFARQTFKLHHDSRDWKVKSAQRDIIETGCKGELICKALYRPFDVRYSYYTGNSRGIYSSPQKSIMTQFLHRENIGLTVGRQGQVAGDLYLWNLVFVTDSIIDFNLFYRGGELLFPLYLYKRDETKKRRGFQTMMLFEPEEEYGNDGRKPNITPVVFEKLKHYHSQQPTPELILYYCYAVLYSNHYRAKYAEFLKIDFPRIPFTTDHDLFLKFTELGKSLAELHLFKSRQLNKPVVRYRGRGEDLIEKVAYDQERKIVFINDYKYFEGIAPEVWDYHVGGYQVMEKYLKDRKGRPMDDPATYCKIATAILHTITIQNEIDILYPQLELKLIDF